MQNSRNLDEISKRIKRLIWFVLISIILSAGMIVFFYVLSILALCDVEFAANMLLFVTNKIQIITVLTVCSMIISVLYYSTIAELGRYEYGLLITAIIGFVSFLYTQVSPDITDTDDKKVLFKTCVFGIFLSLLFYCYYCNAMKKLLKKVLKRPSECWSELKKSAFLITGIQAIIMVGLMIAIKLIDEVEEFNSDYYTSYAQWIDAYERYTASVTRRNNTIIVFVLAALGLSAVVSIVLRVYEYKCLKYSLPDEIDEVFTENNSTNNTAG